MATGLRTPGLAVRLAARELAFGYPGKSVGSGVNLLVETGQIICLLGPNGSGKTTFLKTLLGLLEPQGGDVMLNAANIFRYPRRELAQTMAYVPQAHAAYFPFTVLDTVLMGRTAHVRLFSTPSRHDREMAKQALASLGIEALADCLYSSISRGQQQLALIARALAQDAKILIMDEPTASLDFSNQVLVLGHVRRLARNGLGLVHSTHDPNQALACADQVAMLRDGKLVRYGKPDTVVTSEHLRRLYGVDVDVVSIAGSNRRVCVPSLCEP